MTWMDEPTLDYLIGRYGIRSMLDVGCGPGGMQEPAQARGLHWLGIDGDPSLARDDVLIHDYTIGPTWLGFEAWAFYGSVRWDLIWCTEFVEHVEERYIPNFMDTFSIGRVLFLTAAWPGQGGHHHVNEQPARYWIDLLGLHGWQLDTEATQWVRKHGATPFARMTGMVFTKTGQ